MSQSGTEAAHDTVAGIERFLGDQFGGTWTVSNLVPVSAGARRRNVVLDAVTSGEHLRLVATIVPTNIELVPITAEARIRELARDNGVPVPRIHAVCTDPTYVGASFLLSERVDGETVPRRVLRLVDAEGIGNRIAEQLGVAMGRLHGIDPAVAGSFLATNTPIPPRPHWPNSIRPSTCCSPTGRCSPSPCVGSTRTSPDHRHAGRLFTTTFATATSLSGPTVFVPFSTGKVRDAGATRCATPRGQPCGCGVFGKTLAKSVVSQIVRFSSPATNQSAGSSIPIDFIGGRCCARCGGASDWPVRPRHISTVASATS